MVFRQRGFMQGAGLPRWRSSVTLEATRGVYLAHTQGPGEPVANKNGADEKMAKAALRQLGPTAAIGLALAINLAWITGRQETSHT
jgi:hypothetical protein